MEILVAYGAGTVTVRVPDHATVDRFGPGNASKQVDSSYFRECCRTAGLDSFVADAEVLVVVNDGYRSTPTARILGWLDEQHPDLLDNAAFLIATGAHAAPTQEHLQIIFGANLERVRGRVRYHDAHDRDQLVKVGVDRFGEPVYINSQALQHERVLIVGSVEPHYFAGFTGGRKSLFPGLCDFATIERNHNLACSLEAQPLRLQGNPVAEHLAELLSMLDASRFMAIQIVMDMAQNMADVRVGPLSVAFEQAVDTAKKLFSHRVASRYDVVLCEISPPLDRNLYQVQKAFENTQAAVLDGGADIVLSPCAEGVGSTHFYELAERWDRVQNQPDNGKRTFGSHKLARVNLMSRRIDCLLYSELDDATVRSVFFEPVQDLERAIQEKLSTIEDSPGRVAIVHDAAHTVLTET